MDLASSCKDKLTYFRIKELKDILTELGLSKQGKKQDLVERILAILSDDRASGMWAKKNAVGKEQVAKLVEDTYRKMQGSGAADLASKLQGVSDRTKTKLKEETEDSYKIEKIRCLCGSSLPTDSMIKCEDPRCNVWQHIKCVLIPEKSLEGAPLNPPEIFYCEVCRLSRADPFWVTIAHPLYPVKLNITSIPTDGSNPVQSIEKTFQLTRADKDLLAKQEYDVQAWCMLLNDKQTFRMHWPLCADLQVNGVSMRAINRPANQLLGANGRDDGPIISTCTRDGINKISLTGSDARIFCVGVRIVKRRTLQQVLNMIPKESEGEPFADALARVRRCVGGGAATENADSDSDIEVVADFITVNLRCPMSGSRMKVAGRFKPCAHMGCFDLEVFVEMNQRSRKWQCPICLKNYSLEKIIIDPYFNLITSKLRNCEDVAEIEVKPDGSWRAKSEGDRMVLGELGLWHLPDGTICTVSEAESKPKPELIPVKQEAGSDSHGRFKLGIKKNQNGCWKFNKFNDMQGTSSANRLELHFRNNGHNIIPMSSSATGSGRDFGDASINQDGNGNMDYSNVHGTEYESVSLNFDQTNGYNDQIFSVPTGNNEIIVLSDSDEEIEPQMPSGAVLPPENGIPQSYYEIPAFGNGGNSSIGLYGPNDDFGINMWSSLPSTSQGGTGFQLFGSNANETLNCSSSMNGYDTVVGSTGLPSASCAEASNLNDGFVDNPLAFSGEDPSLQIFLPTRPSDASVVRSDLRDHLDDSEDWISLRLGDGCGGRVGQRENMAASNGLDMGKEVQSKDGLDSLADTASLLLGMNGNSSRNGNDNGKTSRESSDSPFTFPRQRRSVRPRLYLSIDTDSE